jgi:hypothetical protein
LIALLGIATVPLIQAADRKGAASNHEAYDDEEIAKAASDFFSTRAKGLSDVLDALFQRFPDVEGSLSFVGGFGVNYLQRDGISLAPVRFGVGWRQGIGVGYMHFTRNKRLNPL